MAKKNMTLEKKLEEAIVNEIPYEVPKSWVWTYMSNIGEYINGKAFKPIEWDTHGLPIIRIQNLTGTNEQYNYFSGEIDDKYKIANNDLLMAWSATLDAFLWSGGDAVLNQHIFKVKSLINRKYHYYLLKNTIQEMYSKTHGTGMVHITKGKFEKLEIPLPPLKEQQRIVDKIESLFEKLDKAKELIEEARDRFEKRKDAILKKALTGELTVKYRKENKRYELIEEIKRQRLNICKSSIEKNKLIREFESADYKGKVDGWINIKAQLVCDFITKGETPTKAISKTGEIPFIKVYNIRNNKLDFDYDKSFIPIEIHENKMKRSKIYPDDVIMNIVGPPLQKVAIITDEYSEWNINQAIAIFRPINMLVSKYLYYCLIYKETLRSILIETRGVVGQSNISLEQCRNLIIPLPPLEEQKEIVRILDKLLEEESKIEELTALEQQIELIKKSILAKAFRGQLGTNCEEDESALELLKEILNN